MERSGTDPMLSTTGVGAYPAQEHRMYSVATCLCANVLSEQKSAMASVTLHRTMKQTMRARTRRVPRDSVRRTYRKRPQPSLRSAGRTAVDLFVSEAWPLGPCALFNLRGYPIQPMNPGLSLIEPTTTRA